MKQIPFERVKKIALANVGIIRQHICRAHKATVVAVKHYLETGEALRTRAYGRPNVTSKLTEALEGFIRGLDVRCVGELLEFIPRGMDNRLPGWLYGDVVAFMDNETGEWVLEPKEAA